MKKLFVALLMAAGVTVAQAQVTGNMAVTTDYRFRGVSQTQNSLAVQGGMDLALPTGVYVGNWNSSVSADLYTRGAGVENDLYAGYKTELGKDITLDVGSYNYFYPRATASGEKFDTYELYAGLAMGPYSVKLSRSLNDYFGITNSKGSTYVNFDYVRPVNKELSVVAHVGHTSVEKHHGFNYTDWNVGLAYDLNGWVVSGKYYTNTNETAAFKTANTLYGQKLYKDTVVFAVAKNF